MGINKINSKSNWGEAAANLNNNFDTLNADILKIKDATTRNKGYFATSENLFAALPSAKVGDVAFVGAEYPYAVYRWDGIGWANNGEVGGESVDLHEYPTKDELSAEISGLVVQETGDSEGVVMSQKAVTEKIRELDNEISLVKSSKIVVDWVSGRFINETGTVGYDNNYNATIDYIPVRKGDRIYCNCYASGNGDVIAIYDIKKELLETKSGKQITIDIKNDGYIRLSNRISSVASPYVELLDTVTIESLSECINNLNQIDNALLRSDLLKGNIYWRNKRYVNIDGNLSADANYSATENYYPIIKGDIIQATLKLTPTSYCIIYDADKKVSKVVSVSNPIIYVENDGYIRFSNDNRYCNNPIITILSNETILDDETLNKTSVEYEITNIASGLLTNKGGVYMESSTTYKYSERYYQVAPNGIVYVRCYGTGDARGICFYDKGGNFISSAVGHLDDEMKIDVPSKAYYARISSEYPDRTGLSLRFEGSNVNNVNDEDSLNMPYYVANITDNVADKAAYNMHPTTIKIEHKYIGGINPLKKYVAIGFDDFRDADFTAIIPLFNKYGAKATFNRPLSSKEISPSSKQRIENVIFSLHEMGDHTVMHYKFPFDEPMFNGQNPSATEGNQVPFPSNDELRNDRGDGKNVFGIILSSNVKETIGYQAPDIDVTWADMTDSQCQQFREYFSVMFDKSSGLITLLDELSNKYLGTSGASKGSWNGSQYTGGIYTGCKTSANHEIWERYFTIVQMYYKEEYGLNYDIKTWSLPGSKSSYCYYEEGGKKYYDKALTMQANNLAKFNSSLLNKARSLTDVLRDFQYNSTHDANYPSRIDGSSKVAMANQYIYNAYLSREDALVYPTNRQIYYPDIVSEYPESFFSGSSSREQQMYEGGGTFYHTLEKWRHSTSNGIIWGEVIDSADTFSEKQFFESLLRFAKSAGIELITKQEAFDICFNHSMINGNIIYNPTFENSIRKFIPNASNLPTNPDGYLGNCYVSYIDNKPSLVTLSNVTYVHYGIPVGVELTYSAQIMGKGTIIFKSIKNSTKMDLSDAQEISRITIDNVELLQEKTNIYMPINELTDKDSVCDGYGEKICGIVIEYSGGLTINCIKLTV